MRSVRIHLSAVVVLASAVLSHHALAQTEGTAPTDSQALLSVVATGTVEEVVAALDSGTGLETRDEYGQTALMYASDTGAFDVVELLLKRGANPNARSLAGWTALMYAARGGHTATAQLLLGFGADTSIVTPEGTSARSLADAASARRILASLDTHEKDPNAYDRSPPDEATSRPRPRARSSTPIGSCSTSGCISNLVGEEVEDLWHGGSNRRFFGRIGGAPNLMYAVFKGGWDNPRTYARSVSIYVVDTSTRAWCGWEVDTQNLGNAWRQSHSVVRLDSRTSVPAFMLPTRQAWVWLYLDPDTGQCGSMR